MYRKGCSFLGAAIIVRQHGGDPWVALHLQAQAIELILKALLLARDYDRYQPRLRRVGHNLIKAVDTVTQAYDRRQLSGVARNELTQLSDLYRHHFLRYASNVDIIIDPRSVETARTLRRLYGLVRFVHDNRLLMPGPGLASYDFPAR
jgi:hypothetical protein